MNDVEWGVSWKVATLPEDGSVPDMPERPVRPAITMPTYDPQTGNPIAPLLTDEQTALQEQFLADMQAFEQAVVAREAVIDHLLDNADNWQTTVVIAPSGETEARETLETLLAVNSDNKYARHFQLVTAAPRVWTPVPVS